jgi:hypothetical protein
MAQTLTLEQATALANDLSTGSRWADLESLVQTWLRALPAEPSKARDAMERQLREKLIEALFRQARVDESLASFLDLARASAPDIPRPFVDLYVEAMKRTQAMPVPLNRVTGCTASRAWWRSLSRSKARPRSAGASAACPRT